MGSFDNVNAVYLFVVASFLIISLVTSRFHSSQPLLQYALVWVGIFMMFTIAYSYKERIQAVIFPSMAINENGKLMFRKSSDGHYHVDAIVDGTPIKFIVDTGATDLILSPKDAAKIGFNPEKLHYDKQYITANGIVGAASIIISIITIGGVEFRDVHAAINSSSMQSSLLGLSFLERFEYYQFQDDQLILKY